MTARKATIEKAIERPGATYLFDVEYEYNPGERPQYRHGDGGCPGDGESFELAGVKLKTVIHEHCFRVLGGDHAGRCMIGEPGFKIAVSEINGKKIDPVDRLTAELYAMGVFEESIYPYDSDFDFLAESIGARR